MARALDGLVVAVTLLVACASREQGAAREAESAASAGLTETTSAPMSSSAQTASPVPSLAPLTPEQREERELEELKSSLLRKLGDPSKQGAGDPGSGLVGEEATEGITATINGKAPKDATSADVEKVMRDANCTPKSVSGKSPVVEFAVACSSGEYVVTFAAKGVMVPAAKREALESEGSLFEEDGVLVAVRPATRETDATRARVLLRLLQGDPNAGLEGKVTGSGRMSGDAPTDVTIAVNTLISGARRCYNSGLLRDPALEGSFRVVLQLGARGEVTTSKAIESTPHLHKASGIDLIACVESRGLQLRFAAPASVPTDVRVRLGFTSRVFTP